MSEYQNLMTDQIYIHKLQKHKVERNELHNANLILHAYLTKQTKINFTNETANLF